MMVKKTKVPLLNVPIKVQVIKVANHKAPHNTYATPTKVPVKPY